MIGRAYFLALVLSEIRSSVTADEAAAGEDKPSGRLALASPRAALSTVCFVVRKGLVLP